jgi:pyruvate dehydrogenase E2 component (dihydrolipoamide acetyltransferase)
MADVTMPRLSDTMEEGTIGSWLKQPGDQINKGDVLAQVETDKATMDLTAFEAGTLQEILAPEGTTVAIGQPVARIGSGPAAKPAGGADQPAGDQAQQADGQQPAGERQAPPTEGRAQQATGEGQQSAAQAEQAGGDGQQGTATSPGAESTGSQQPQTPEARQNLAESPDPSKADAGPPILPAPPPEPPRQDGAEQGKVRASPMARHIAAEHGLDLGRIQGSGPLGRVVRADVEAALSAGAARAQAAPAEAQPAAPAEAAGQPPAAPAQVQAGEDDERVPLSQMRRTIARRMAESTRSVPHFFLTTVIDATELGALRRQLIEQLESEGIKPSFNDLVIKGAAHALRRVPELNVSFAEDALIKHHRVHIGIAVATERGLIVPVVRDADRKPISEISREARELAQKAQQGKLQPPDYSGGTFTVSNLGMFGVEQFNAVINPPEAGILAVGTITREPAEYQGQIVLRDRMRLTLSVDHRATDGATGARYLQELKKILEKPLLLLV